MTGHHKHLRTSLDDAAQLIGEQRIIITEARVLVAGALAELLLLQPLLGQEIGQSTRFRRMVNMLADAGSRLSQPAPTARGLTTAGEVHDTPPPSDGELRQAALDALEFIEPYVDVVDGDYGEPAPNRAMTIASNLRNALGDTQ